jgi:hypothetical protein
MALGTINHLSLTVSDRSSSEPFYDQILQFMGYQQPNFQLPTPYRVYLSSRYIVYFGHGQRFYLVYILKFD